MKHLLIAPAIIAVVLMSGCTIPGMGSSIVTGNGLVIDAFEPDFSDVYSGEPVTLQAKITNTGSVGASSIELGIHGISEDDWSGITLTSSTGTDALMAPDPIAGTSGGTLLMMWSMKAPELPKGISLAYNPTLRVNYEYRTTSIKSLSLLPLADARRLQQQGKTFSADTVSATSSPVSFTIKTKSPIRVFGSDIKFPLEIVISNVGGGTVCSEPSCDEGTWNKFRYEISAPGDASLSGISIDPQCASGEITLFRGQSNTITCEITVDEVPPQPIQKQIQVQSNYGYFIDKTTSITVTGI